MEVTTRQGEGAWLRERKEASYIIRGSACLLGPRPGVPSPEATSHQVSDAIPALSVLPRGQSPRLRLGRPGPGSAVFCAALSWCPMSFRFHTTHVPGAGGSRRHIWPSSVL